MSLTRAAPKLTVVEYGFSPPAVCRGKFRRSLRWVWKNAPETSDAACHQWFAYGSTIRVPKKVDAYEILWIIYWLVVYLTSEKYESQMGC